MATNNTLKNQLANKPETVAKQVSAGSLGLKNLLNTPTMSKKFEQVLGKKAPQFMSSLLNIYNGDIAIREAEPMSIVSSALVAATLDLPIDKNLGYAWIVPFYDSKKGHKAAQFQLGYKGYIQLFCLFLQAMHFDEMLPKEVIPKLYRYWAVAVEQYCNNWLKEVSIR